MNQTEGLLLEIRDAISDGRLKVEQVPMEEIKRCLQNEIFVNRNTFLENQYSHVLKNLERLCADISNFETDKNKIILFIDAAVLCLGMISQAVQTLANGEFWMYKHQHELDNPEVMEIIDYIERERKISLLNYDFIKEYDDLECKVCYDEKTDMRFLPYKGRNMYFPRGWEEHDIITYYRSVVAEQDSRSPHCYKKAGYYVEAGDVVVDAGAAEGIFALDVIDKAKKIYLIEADEQWVEALQQTFRKDEDKVQIIFGFLDSSMEGDRVSLDALFEKEQINYIKMDIEGYEKAALSGADATLDKNRNIKCAICSYHCREDEQWIRDRLQAHGFMTDVSRGYMCPDWTSAGCLEAELRRGVVFGRKG